jgi:predicted DNA-binding protein
MSHTISIRLPEETNRRLEERSRKTGRSRSALVKEALEQSLKPESKAFMALAGSIEGAPDLSQRKGFAKK